MNISNLRIAVIGAGWFGCHIACSLKAKGARVVVYEAREDVFTGASLTNTGRLHLGFHYPRSFITREQCKEGFGQFEQTYGAVCESIQPNYYLIADNNSIIDHQTYLQILNGSNLPYLLTAVPPQFKNISAAIECQEKAINPYKARAFFKESLKDQIQFNTPVDLLNLDYEKPEILGEPFDFIINCTYYQTAANFLPNQVCYENVVTLLLNRTNPAAQEGFVIMDGKFFSLNPHFVSFHQKQYSLYHVKHSVVFSSGNLEEVTENHARLLNTSSLERYNTDAMRNSVETYYPKFFKDFQVTNTLLSVRTKPVNEDANRSCMVNKEKRVIHVLSGKINSIFDAFEQCRQLITATS